MHSQLVQCSPSASFGGSVAAGMRRSSSAGSLTAHVALVAPVASRLGRELTSISPLPPRPPMTRRLRATHICAVRQQVAEAPGAQGTQAVVQPASSTSPALASLTRVLLIGQPTNLMRGLAGKNGRALGPFGLLLFCAAVFISIMAAVRAVLVRRVRSCDCCRGYGIIRCRLCNGEGAVEWRGACLWVGLYHVLGRRPCGRYELLLNIYSLCVRRMLFMFWCGVAVVLFVSFCTCARAARTSAMLVAKHHTDQS
jgi:hypothetical protein